MGVIDNVLLNAKTNMSESWKNKRIKLLKAKIVFVSKFSSLFYISKKFLAVVILNDSGLANFSLLFLFKLAF